MAIKKIEIICKYCGKSKIIGDQTYKRRPSAYCSFQCSADYKRDEFLKSWLNEEINGTYNNSKTKGLHKRINRWYKENIKKCEICKQDFKSFQGLSIHLNSKHSDITHEVNI